MDIVIVWEAYARPLMLMHTLAAFMLLGAATHHGLMVRAIAWNPRFNASLSRVYASVSVVAYLTTTALGAVVYPAYRYYVRGLYLDRHALWASRLFDIKEDLAVLGALSVVGIFILSRSVSMKSERRHLVVYSGLVWTVAIIVWVDTVSGLLISMARSV